LSVSGTPTTAGPINFSLTATDSAQQDATQSYTLAIDPALAINTPSLPPGNQGTAYSQAIAVAGGLGPYTITATGLPAGLSMAAGSITGTPTVAGSSFAVNVTATDSIGRSVSRPYTLIITPPFVFTPATLPRAMVGRPYMQEITLTGGQQPYTWSVPGPIPGSGLTVGTNATNNAAAVVAGTPTSATSPNFNLGVTDFYQATASRSYGVIIDPALTITTPELAAGYVGGLYSQTIAVTGGLPPYTVTATGLPAGLSVTGNVIGGTPTAAGTSPLVTVTATDAAGRQTSREYSLVVLTQLVITTASLPAGTFGNSYTAALSATGGGARLVWSVASGSLAGLTLNSETGVITGVPNATGTFPVTFQVTDSVQTVAKTLTLTVAPRVETLSITTDSLPDGTYDVPYAASVLATGGEEPYSFSFSGLPPGLSGNSNGALFGRPTDIGRFNVRATVTDKGSRTSTRTYSLLVVAAPLVITTASPLAGANVGSPVSVTFAATGGVPPYTWLPSSGPPGTTVSGGVLSGTPTEAGQFEFTVQVRDSKGTVASKSFSMTVTALPLVVDPATLPQGKVGQTYTAGFSARGGFPPYRWSISGLPGGLSGSGAGEISGRPTSPGRSSVTATVTDSRGATASGTAELTVLPADLSIETGSPLPNGTMGVAYSQTFTAAGGVPPYQWAITAGYAGSLGITAEGVLRGTPAEAGPFNFHVEVTDAAGAKAGKTFAVTIDQPVLTITTSSLPNGMVGTAYSASVSASGNIGSVSWSASGLPNGLSMSDSGAISGTPATGGTASVGVTARDAAGRTANRTLSLTVLMPPPPAPTFMGMPSTVPPASQIPVGLGIQGTYPAPINGTITLTFTADGGGADDPAVQFSNGRRQVVLTIPAGESLATFTIPNLALQTGTVAGVITLTANLTTAGQDITPTPVQTIRINPAPPVIVSVTPSRTSTGIQIVIAGYANTREVTSALFTLRPAAGFTLQTTDFTVQVGALFSAWYQNAASVPFGSQFLFTQPFTVGEAGSVASVTVTLLNTVGRSNSVTANVP
jgi:hypothetical protein